MSLEDRVKQVLASVLDISAEEITDDTSTDTVASWDSMHAMQLFAVLEDEFEITLSDDEAMEMMSYGLIVRTLREKLQA